jgi:hypothetical protein
MSESIRDRVKQSNASPTRREVKDHPWGDVWVRKISARDALDLERVTLNGDGKQRDTLETLARTVAKCLCDADGRRVFSDDEADLEVLRDADVQALKQAFDAAADFNGLTAKAQEALAENFPAAPSDSSPSDSPSLSASGM